MLAGVRWQVLPGAPRVPPQAVASGSPVRRGLGAAGTRPRGPGVRRLAAGGAEKALGPEARQALQTPLVQVESDADVQGSSEKIRSFKPFPWKRKGNGKAACFNFAGKGTGKFLEWLRS